MFCSKCGKEINNDVKFCPFCGFKIHEVNEGKRTSTQLKEIYEYPETNFKTLNTTQKKLIIWSKIANTNESHWTYEHLHKVLSKFEAGFYNQEQSRDTLYEDLFRDELSDIPFFNPMYKTPLTETIIKSFAFIWVLNTIFASGLPTLISDEKWEGWYIPGLSEITPMMVQELTILGKGEFRLASQAEVWRTNRRRRKLKENINNIQDFDLNKIENNLEELLK